MSDEQRPTEAGLWLCRDSATQWWRMVKVVNGGLMTAPWIMGHSHINDFDRYWRKPTTAEIGQCQGHPNWMLMNRDACNEQLTRHEKRISEAVG